MPYTPYHFGPSGFVGLLCRKWIDVPVFVAANVLIDIEVIADQYFAPGWPVHQLWHFHTLLIGSLVGAAFGVLVYFIKPLRWCSEKSMSLIGLPSKATIWSMLLAGLLGVCFHVLIDSFYHSDVQLFWPYPKNPIHQWALHSHISNKYIRIACTIGWALMAALYALLLALNWRKNQTVAPTE